MNCTGQCNQGRKLCQHPDKCNADTPYGFYDFLASVALVVVASGLGWLAVALFGR